MATKSAEAKSKAKEVGGKVRLVEKKKNKSQERVLKLAKEGAKKSLDGEMHQKEREGKGDESAAKRFYERGQKVGKNIGFEKMFKKDEYARGLNDGCPGGACRKDIKANDDEAVWSRNMAKWTHVMFMPKKAHKVLNKAEFPPSNPAGHTIKNPGFVDHHEFTPYSKADLGDSKHTKDHTTKAHA